MAIAGCAESDTEEESDVQESSDEDSTDSSDEDTDDSPTESDEDSQEYANNRDEPLEVAFGNEAETSHGIVASAGDLEFQDTYTYEGVSGTEREAEPDTGNKFVFIQFYAENQGDEEGRLPPERTMDVLVGNEQFGRERYRGDESEIYEGDDVQPGIRREGLILFQVPEDAELDEVILVLNDGFLDVGMNVRWVSE